MSFQIQFQLATFNFLENETKNKYLDKLSVPYLSVYPNDHTEQMNEDDISPGNLFIPKEKAEFVVASDRDYSPSSRQHELATLDQ